MKSAFGLSLFGGVIVSLCACSGEEIRPSSSSDTNETAELQDSNDLPGRAAEFRLCKGTDISWLTEMEALGYKFYYSDGTEGDCLEILKSKGVNAIRLRVWVNPENSYCGVDDVLVKAERAAALGLDVMVDFHYSDVWADPSAQTVPETWKGHSIDQMVEAVGDFTTTVLSRLSEKEVSVKWVQIGNETGNGMLWPLGQADKNPDNYARLTQAGIDAVRKAIPEAETIVHLQSGENTSLAKWLLGILDKRGVDYDIAGFSLYPEWNNYEDFVEKARVTMETVIQEFDKDVMLCEVGMPFQYQKQSYEFLNLCFDLSKQIPDNRYRGLLYWEPQAYNNFNGYNKGAFLTNGRPSKAMDAFSYSDTGIRPVYAD